MNQWLERSPEERALLAPSFLSLLLWKAATGHSLQGNSGLPLACAFLTLPMSLHRDIRDALPDRITTSLAVWVGQHHSLQAQIADRARVLVPFTKEALIFGGLHNLVSMNAGSVEATPSFKRQVGTVLGTTSDEVQECARRAEFLGKWFARTGSSHTVLALLGVRP